ncbi:YceI family protein [Rhodoferax fermentans]|uniref:Polyisoprenoid-binding protein n=1 Tax=Rhodoferax fermentans TaxID=28066 RepID=A0A1T1ATD2_RHOFE|nr:YceI family protein [Rhodoferax fermentans]MBK1682305.1 polyisoprenoid-binding protein [Rhodoferax fermentans]OOV07245.1 polyisoprenoid-binding protein [Rhodoferax fermentans]
MRLSLIPAAAAAVLLASTVSAQAASYAIDPTHTYVTFEIGHFGTSTNRGRFDKKEGSVELDRAAKTGKVEIVVDTSSISTGFAMFNKHLQSAELFDVEKFPTMKFAADKFVFNGDKVAEVTGTLTLLGKTNPLTLKATNFNCYENPMLKREVCGGDFEGTLDRTQYGMNYGIDWGFPKNVHLVVQVEAVKQ